MTWPFKMAWIPKTILARIYFKRYTHVSTHMHTYKGLSYLPLEFCEKFRFSACLCVREDLLVLLRGSVCEKKVRETCRTNRVEKNIRKREYFDIRKLRNFQVSCENSDDQLKKNIDDRVPLRPRDCSSRTTKINDHMANRFLHAWNKKAGKQK